MNRSPRTLNVILLAGFVLLVTLVANTVLVGSLLARPAGAHGSTQSPASRVYTCRFENPNNSMCDAAWSSNSQALYDWMEVNIGDAAGRHRELIPDGQLCSAGRQKYAAFDQPGTWPVTALSTNGSGLVNLVYQNTAPHSTEYYRVYITRQGFDARTDRLGWSDLELAYDSGRLDRAAQQTLQAPLPNRDVPAVLYIVWQRSDSPEAFYACSDVTVNGSSPNPPPTTTPTTVAPTTAPPAPSSTAPNTSAPSSTTAATSPPSSAAPATSASTAPPTTAPGTTAAPAITALPTTTTTAAAIATTAPTTASSATAASATAAPTTAEVAPSATNANQAAAAAADSATTNSQSNAEPISSARAADDETASAGLAPSNGPSSPDPATGDAVFASVVEPESSRPGRGTLLLGMAGLSLLGLVFLGVSSRRPEQLYGFLGSLGNRSGTTGGTDHYDVRHAGELS